MKKALEGSRQVARPLRWGLALLALLALGAPSWALAQTPTTSDYVKEFGPRLSAISEQVQLVQRQRVSSEELSPKRLAASMGRRATAQSLYFYVRDEIAFDPYEGELRGARGTLMSRSGNSLDQSLLLQELLAEVGVKSRIAWGKLGAKEINALLTDYVGEAKVTGLTVPAGTPLYEPTRDRALINTVREHYWVEANLDRKWTAMDPSFKRAAMGVPATTKEGESDGVPPQAQLTATVKLFIEGADGRPRSLMALQDRLGELSYRNLTLSFAESDAKGTTRTPRMVIAGKATRGEGFRPADVKRMWLEFFFDRGGKSQSKVQRDLFVEGSALDVFQADQQIFSMLILPGWLNTDFFKAVAQQELSSLYTGGEEMRKVIEAGAALTVREAEVLKRASAYVEELVGKAGGMLALTYAMVADRTSLRMANKLGVRAFFDEPRVVIVGGFRKDDRLYWQIDLRNDNIRAVPAKGLPRLMEYAFQAMRGRFNSQFEATVVSTLTGKPVLSVYEAFDQAVEEKIPVVTLVPENLDPFLPKMKISTEAGGRIKEEVRKAGKAVLAPAKGAKFGGTSVMVWWSMDPVTGALVGRREDGTNGGFSTPMLTGKPADARPRTGNIEVLLFDEALTLLYNLSGTVAAMLRGEPNVCSVSCATVKDLVKLPTLMCVDGAARGATKLPLDDEMAACLQPVQGGGGDDIFGVSVGCDALVHASKCGAVMSVGNIVNRYQLEFSTPPVGPITGPWKASELQPFDLAGCGCK